MFARMIDDFKDSTSSALRLTSLATSVALAFFVMLSFLCAAAFVYALQRYGLVEACLTGAGFFLVATLIAAAFYSVRKRQLKAAAAAKAKYAAQTAGQSMLADPMLVTAGIQVIRAIGVKKLIPILAVGGLALGLMASRGNSVGESPAE